MIHVYEFSEAFFGLPLDIIQRIQQKRLERTQPCTNCPLLETTPHGHLVCRAEREAYNPDPLELKVQCFTSAAYRACPRFAEGSIQV